MTAQWIVFLVFLGFTGVTGYMLYHLTKARKEQIVQAREKCESRSREVEQAFSLAASPTVPPIPDILLANPAGTAPNELGLDAQVEDEQKSRLMTEFRQAGNEVKNPHIAGDYLGEVIAIRDGFVIQKTGRNEVSLFPADQIDCAVGDKLRIRYKGGRWIAETARDSKSRGGNMR